jgi:hypothetical protein
VSLVNSDFIWEVSSVSYESLLGDDGELVPVLDQTDTEASLTDSLTGRVVVADSLHGIRRGEHPLVSCFRIPRLLHTEYCFISNRYGLSEDEDAMVLHIRLWIQGFHCWRVP